VAYHAFAVAHRSTESLGCLFEKGTRQTLLPDQLDALGVPRGPERAVLARGEPIVLADGRSVTPEMVMCKAPTLPVRSSPLLATSKRLLHRSSLYAAPTC
jgi:hypothetical protein